MPITATDILNALVASSDDKIWATELAIVSCGRRVDFWTLEPAASRGFRATAYEIKVSKADFRRDNDVKQSGALKWSDRFWYVTPPGVLARADLPEWAGLMEWDGRAFSVKRKAPMRAKAAPDWEFVVSLLRNSGDVRRDVDLYKSQIAFFEVSLRRMREQAKLRSRLMADRWFRHHADHA